VVPGCSSDDGVYALGHVPVGKPVMVLQTVEGSSAIIERFGSRSSLYQWCRPDLFLAPVVYIVALAQLVASVDVYVLDLYEEALMGVLIRWLVRLLLFRVLVSLWRIVRRR
jgi:uncharacterized membrane protein YfcA